MLTQYLEAGMPWSTGVKTRVAIGMQQYNGSLACGLCIMFRCALPFIKLRTYVCFALCHQEDTTIDCFWLAHLLKSAGLNHSI